MDDVAGIDETQTHAPGQRRRDAAVRELQLGVVDRALVHLHHALVLAH